MEQSPLAIHHVGVAVPSIDDAMQFYGEKLGLSLLECAKLRGRQAGLKVQTRLIRTRNPGAAIVEEAERQNAEIIYLGTAHAPPSERALGPTAMYLLAHRPCRVVIETPPAANGAVPVNGEAVLRAALLPGSTWPASGVALPRQEPSLEAPRRDQGRRTPRRD